MGALTPQFLFDFESNMQAITENEYARFALNLWWSRFMKSRPSSSKREMVAWLLSTARIEDQGLGGNISFEDIVATYTEFVNKDAGAGLRLRRQQLEDLDGGGLDIASKWAADIGAYMAYWPQKQLVSLIKNGEVGKGYDGKAFFASDHPLNPFNDGAGTFANLFTGAASGSFPGACPIDDSVTIDVALQNLAKIVAYIKSIKMPNGEDPRFLRPVELVVPPRMAARAQQLTNAKFIAQAAASGGGAADVEAVIANFGFAQPTVADELAGDDKTFYIGCEELGDSPLGAFVYVDREPFTITYYSGQSGATGVDAVLDRAQELEWHCHGRNVAGYGHPYRFYKCKAT